MVLGRWDVGKIEILYERELEGNECFCVGEEIDREREREREKILSFINLKLEWVL